MGTGKLKAPCLQMGISIRNYTSLVVVRKHGDVKSRSLCFCISYLKLLSEVLLHYHASQWCPEAGAREARDQRDLISTTLKIPFLVNDHHLINHLPSTRRCSNTMYPGPQGERGVSKSTAPSRGMLDIPYLTSTLSSKEHCPSCRAQPPGQLSCYSPRPANVEQ